MTQDAATQPGQTQQPRVARAEAELDGLVELISIFTHDLSNPLQSITVLCELAVDDAELGSDERQRNEQCLCAAERMRDLIHGLAGVARYSEGLQTIGSMMKRALALMERRFARHLIQIEVDVKAIERVRPPNTCEHAILNLALGVIATAAGRGGKHRLLVVGESDGRDCTLSFAAKSSHGVEEETLLPGDEHIERVRALIAGEPASLIVADSSVALRFTPREV